MRGLIESVEAEYRRYKAMGEGVLDQLDADLIVERPSAESNSIATIVWHVAGNLASRFTDFLTSDGEKPWRNREDEFVPRRASPGELRDKWEEGWGVVLDALAGLTDADLAARVTIRGVELSVAQALHRSLAHTAYHVGQMTYVGKMLRGPAWTYLTIPPGGTAAYNENPIHEKGPGA